MESPPQAPADLDLPTRCPRRSRLCECGCGQETPLASKTQASKGWVKGCPVRFIPGHQARRQSAGAVLDPDSGCFVWQGRRTSDGYALATVDGRTHRVHRVLWECLRGPVPDGLVLDHLCRNRACVNPSHLEAVTPAENVRRGSVTRLTPSEARTIRRLGTKGLASDRELAMAFGISPIHAGNIRRGLRWHLDEAS